MPLRQATDCEFRSVMAASLTTVSPIPSEPWHKPVRRLDRESYSKNTGRSICYVPYFRPRSSDAAGNLAVSNNQVLTTRPATVAAAGLVAYWKFDEGSGTLATDSSGGGNDGVLVNGTMWTVGKFGSALSFDGIDDLVFIGQGRLNGTGDITISAWIKSDSTGGHAYPRIISNSNLELSVSREDALLFFTSDSTNSFETTSPNTFSLDQWHHVLVVRNARTNRVDIFIDGVKQLDNYPTGVSSRVVGD
jgi:Concanavalin A-like lectin/glucanases superfamily